jgi:CheY-like chemotaxis protein
VARGHSPPRRQHRALVVDDDPDVRALLADTLSEAGHTVAHAANGVEALAVLREQPLPCMVLCDVRMPRMDGWELSHVMAHEGELASVPVVLVTGDRMLTFRMPALDKPMAAAELDALIQRSCRLHRVAEDGSVESSQPTQSAPLMEPR